MNRVPPSDAPALGAEGKCPDGKSPLDGVLVAEDDPIFRRVLQSWLQKWNYRVTALENGADA